MGRLSKGFFNKYQQSGTLKKKEKKTSATLKQMCWNIRWLDWYFVCGIWSSFLNTTQHRRREVVGKIQKHSLFEILALCLNRPVQNIYEAHISLIFKRLTMWSKSVGKKYLKCLDKYCIIWSHKWCQDVTRFLLNKWKITESMPPPNHTHPE